jgi:hypothetical protein
MTIDKFKEALNSLISNELYQITSTSKDNIVFIRMKSVAFTSAVAEMLKFHDIRILSSLLDRPNDNEYFLDLILQLPGYVVTIAQLMFLAEKSWELGISNTSDHYQGIVESFVETLNN